MGNTISIAWAEMVNRAMVAMKVRHPKDRMYLLTESESADETIGEVKALTVFETNAPSKVVKVV